MNINTLEADLLQAARSEDLRDEQIGELTVLGTLEKRIVDTLKLSGTHLIEGARGVGKSMLLKEAEIQMDVSFSETRQMAVYVSFKTSTLLEGVRAGKKDAFQAWVGAKILEGLHDKLLSLDLIQRQGVSDPYARIFGISSVGETKTILQDKIHLLQKLATTTEPSKVLQEIGEEFLEKLYDTNFLLNIIKEILQEFKISRLVFLFDEAAHTFIPEQQEMFFEIVKLLHGGNIAVKAAVYPSVTSYGRNFEIGQDAIKLSLDRFEPGEAGRVANRTLFREMLVKRLPNTSNLNKKIFSKGSLLDQCIDLSSGNPRGFFHLLNRTIDKGYTDRALLLATQDYVDQELLPYHLNLTKRLPKYSAHVKLGLELLKGYIIPEIKKKNGRDKKVKYQSAFFTVPRDITGNIKLSLALLTYSGILTS